MNLGSPPARMVAATVLPAAASPGVVPVVPTGPVVVDGVTHDDHAAYMETVARSQIRDMLFYAVFVLVFTFALLFNRNDQRPCFRCSHHLHPPPGCWVLRAWC